jgi:hypothetical protein
VLFGQDKPNYSMARKEISIAWERLYPLPFSKIVNEDPLKRGVFLEKRKDNRQVWIYNFTIFMPKYDRNQNDPKALEQGREILVYFLWEPSNLEEPYRIQLGELNQNL